MILSAIRDYLRDRGQASLAEIALHFDTDPEAVRGMLDIWIRRGKVHRGLVSDACGSRCLQCDSTVFELYIWGNEPRDSAAPAETCSYR